MSNVTIAESDIVEFSAVPLGTVGSFLEPLHDYTVGAKLTGGKDSAQVNEVLKQICGRLHQRTLLPARSSELTLRRLSGNGSVEVQWLDGVKFLVAAEECVLLPIMHSTAEELAEYIAMELVKQFGQETQVKVSDFSQGPTQSGCFTVPAVLADPSTESDETKTPSSGAESEVRLAPSTASDVSDPGEVAFRLLLSTLGVQESSRHELDKTPARAAKAFREMTAGLRVEQPLSIAGDAVFDVDGAHDLVAVREIPFHSLCEHHLLPFAGTAHIAYFPNGRVLGLSKFARLLEVFARRLQLQERLGHQLAEALVELLGPKGVAVSLEAYHTCMSHRGASVPSKTRTICLRGPLKDEPCIREQLLSGVSR